VNENVNFGVPSASFVALQKSNRDFTLPKEGRFSAYFAVQRSKLPKIGEAWYFTYLPMKQPYRRNTKLQRSPEQGRADRIAVEPRDPHRVSAGAP